MLKQPEHLATIAGLVSSLNAAQSDFDEKYAAIQVIKENALKIRSAVSAAESEAQQARKGLRETLRNTLGESTKQLLKQSSVHRANIELAEEYSNVASELDSEAAKATIEISSLAAGVISLRDKLRDTYADLLLKEAIEEVAPRLKLVTRIQSSEASAFIGHSDAVRAASERIGMKMNISVASSDVTAECLPDDVQKALDSADVHDIKPMSPLMQKKELAALGTTRNS